MTPAENNDLFLAELYFLYSAVPLFTNPCSAVPAHQQPPLESESRKVEHQDLYFVHPAHYEVVVVVVVYGMMRG